jgi:Wiskott-Aldrich syndrome protein
VPAGGQGIQESVPAEVFSDGRSSLMASIRGSGGMGALRRTEGPREPSPLAAAGYETGSSGATTAAASSGGDLASSLAMALKQRATAMQSDEEDEGDNDEWED